MPPPRSQILHFDHPADAVVSRYFQHRELGLRERATLTETVYPVLRRKPYFELLARRGGECWRRASPGDPGAGCHRPISSRARSARRKTNGLAACTATRMSSCCRSTATTCPNWLADALQQLGARAVCSAGRQPAAARAAGSACQRPRAPSGPMCSRSWPQAAASGRSHAFLALGLRLRRTPGAGPSWSCSRRALSRCRMRARSCWHCCWMHAVARWWWTSVPVPAARPWRPGCRMRNAGRLYAFDVSAHRLEKLEPAVWHAAA